MENSKKLACDIVVVGSGVSGLCAAVQAAELGKKVILIESCNRAGGNWNVTYGAMAVESPISKKQGVHVDAMALVNQELRLFNHQVNAFMWKDLVTASGDNIAWLMAQGVEFIEELEPYTVGDINAPVFHAWKKENGASPSKKMLAAFEKNGGTLLTNTKGNSLLFDDGKISGIIAIQNGDTKLRIDCSSVIVAGGGYILNEEMMHNAIGRTDFAFRGVASPDGSTINMCIDAGAKSLVDHCNLIGDIIPRQMKKVSNWLDYVISRPGAHPYYISVNQDAERYVDESCSLKLFAFAVSAALTQERSFTIFDDKKLKNFSDAGGRDVYQTFTKLAAENEEGIFKANSIEELAEKLGLDANSLKQTIETYNNACQTGFDADFEKNPDYLHAFEAPFYGWEDGYQFVNSVEGIDYNRKMEVLSRTHKPIPGLYVAGVDGGKLWRDYYSIFIPGSCNANNIYSGRRAAQEAAKYADSQ